MNKLDIIKSFGQKKILLIGDTILDVYSYSQAVCKALDAPTIEAEQNDVSISFGGASLVANNILELGGSLIYFTVVGDDKNAKYYDSFNYPKLDKHFLVDKNRRTTVKRKFWVDGYKLLQINEVDNQDINLNLEKKIIKLIEPFVSDVDLIIIFDAQHGLLIKNLINYLIKLSKKYNKPLYVDSQVSHKSSNHHLYKGADCVFLNQTEAMAVNSSLSINKPKSLLNSLKQELGISNVIVKIGAKGSLALFNNKYIKTPSHRVKTVDACGAGDAFLAAFSLGNTKLITETLDISNIWAAQSTTIYGTKIAKKQDLINICRELQKNI